MAEPIYRMFYSRWKEAWYQLSQEQQNTLLGAVNNAFQSVGGTMVILRDSSWASEKWLTWGVEEFPSLDAMQEYAAQLTKLNWFSYSEAETLLGLIPPSSKNA